MKRKSLTIILITIFSVILWVFVSLDEDYRTIIKSKIKITHLPEGYAVGYESVDEAAFTVKGEGFNLVKFSWGNVDDFEISAKNGKGVRQSYLRDDLEQNIWLSSAGQILEIFPEKVDFFVDRVTRKTVILKPDVKLKFRENYGLVSDISFSPDSVEISGPESLIRDIDEVETVYQEFANLEKDVSTLIPIVKKDNINYNINGCSVNFEVQKIVDKNFGKVIVETKNVSPGRELMLLPGSVDIVLRGGIKKLSSMSNEDISVSVDFREAIKDTVGTLKPEITVPGYVTIVDYQPHRLEYIIKHN